VAPPSGPDAAVTRRTRLIVSRPPVLHPDPYVARMLNRVLLLCFTGMAAAFISLVFAFTWVPVRAHWLLTVSLWTGRAAWLTVGGIWVSAIQLWLHQRRREPPGE
jgi:hypothetical protein